MSLVIPAGYAQVIHSLKLNGDADPYAITYGIDQTAANGADVEAIAHALHTAYDTNINPTNPSVLALLQTEVRAQIAGAPDPLVGVWSIPAAGAGGSSALVPQNTALLVHKRTAFGGRAGRGRMYFPALNEANVDSIGQISGAWLVTMASAVNGWLTAITAATNVGTMQLLHDSRGSHAADSPHPVTSLVTDAVAATQRRRLRK